MQGSVERLGLAVSALLILYKMNVASGSSVRFDGIQVLRACAVLPVLWYHAALMLSARGGADPIVSFFSYERWGQFGVLMFFAISGFVIAHAARKAGGGRFMLDRLLRIYPGFLLAVILAVVISYVSFGGFSWGAYSWRAMLLLPVGVHNHVLSVEWTLLYEGVFYSLVMLFLLLRFNLVVVSILWLVLIVVCASCGVVVDLIYPDFLEVVYSPISFPFVFCFLLYQLRERIPMTFLSQGGGWVLSLIFYGFYFCSASTLIAVSAHALGTASAMLAIVNHSPSSMASRMGVLLGDASYGVYLLHATILHVVLAECGFLAPNAASLLPLCLLALGFSTLFGLAESQLHRVFKFYLSGLGRKRRPECPQEGTEQTRR